MSKEKKRTGAPCYQHDSYDPNCGDCYHDDEVPAIPVRREQPAQGEPSRPQESSFVNWADEASEGGEKPRYDSCTYACDPNRNIHTGLCYQRRSPAEPASPPAPAAPEYHAPDCNHISDDLISRRDIYRLIERIAGMTVPQIDHDCMGEPFTKPDAKPSEVFSHVLKAIESYKQSGAGRAEVQPEEGKL